jgi:hypothetical protein
VPQTPLFLRHKHHHHRFEERLCFSNKKNNNKIVKNKNNTKATTRCQRKSQLHAARLFVFDDASDVLSGHYMEIMIVHVSRSRIRDQESARE